MLITTVVGSYPTGITVHSEEEARRAIEIAVNDQVKAGISVISDGQVRTDMVGIFALNMRGYRYEGGRYHISGRIEAPDTPATVKDYLYAKKVAGGKAVVKGIVTGPTTMAKSSVVDKTSPYKSTSDPELIYDLAYAQASEVRALARAGADIIQIDEPFFSVDADLETGIRAVNIVAKAAETPVMHVCGDIRPIFKKLLEANVRVLDHEFAISKNLEAMDRELIEAHGKIIGYGCLDTKSNTIESVETVEASIRKAIEKIGKKNLWIDPDCGMRMRTKEAAYAKLTNMVEAVRKIG
ncbi:methionine synthase [Methanocella arvoryzae]|uniref:Methylcobalamin:homocysteine methyltransferase n=1 Tax=Methanocella arvoryzae (strain DSM 22066 / NBRC 105507 / MRE50) TaxID=351160 RepID=Q0W182_METAR|nr:methionine synthase [Methanocella arvoryzae]CAJ37861.1 putative methylcobalamin:homocysteine methyltransferase [Methanocella arvoryzae MRE50]